MNGTKTCVAKSMLLFVLVIVIFVVFYTYIKNDYQIQTNATDNFSNLAVSNLLNLSTPYPSEIVSDSILTDYNRLITDDFRQRLKGSGVRARGNYETNNRIIVDKLNLMDTNINKMLVDVNNTLYKQLGENYARSQEINNVRQDWLQDIDELPYKVIS